MIDIPSERGVEKLHRFTVSTSAPVRPFAVNNATSCLRLLFRYGRRYELPYRYESWVQLVSRADVMLDVVRTGLRSGTAAWDPYD